MKRFPAHIGALIGTTLMGLVYVLVNGIPKYFAGDDFILLSASGMDDGYASSVIGCVNDLGMGKWRPAFVCTVTPLLKLFGDQYLYFFLLNLGLIFLICAVAAGVLKSVTNLSHVSIAVFTFVLPFSRFAWYGRISPFGLMEFGALLFALLFVRQFLLALQRQTKISWYLAAGMACTASLFHERYLVLLAAGFFVAVINLRNRRISIPVIPWVLYPGSYIAIKLFALRVDPIIGGGEAPIRSSANTWILEHFLIGVKAIAGIGNGTNIGFDATGYLRQPALGVVGKIWLFAAVVILLLILTWRTWFVREVLATKHEINIRLVEQQKVVRQLLLTSGLLLIVPASTIISRIEGRWLFGPEVFLLILLVGVLESNNWRFAILSSYLILSLSCLQFLPKYEDPIRTTNEILEYVHEKLDGRSQLIYTIVDPRGRSDLLDWQLGRFTKFDQLGVQKILYVAPNRCFGSCIKIEFQNTDRFNLVTQPAK
jgi:hypothetical protein